MKTKINHILALLEDKFQYNEALTLFKSLERVTNSETPPDNPKFTILNTELELPVFSVYSQYRETIFHWIRGIFYPMIMLYWINFIYKVIRGTNLTSDTKKILLLGVVKNDF